MTFIGIWRLRSPAGATMLPVADTRRIIAHLDTSQASLDEVIRLTAEAHVRSIGGDSSPGSRQFLITLALRASARSWEDLTRASVERHLEPVADFEEIYDVLRRAHGYRMRAPLTVRDFAVAVAALGEGFAVQAIEGIAHPSYRTEGHGEGAVDLTGGDWTLFAISVRALAHGFMIRDESRQEK